MCVRLDLCKDGDEGWRIQSLDQRQNRTQVMLLMLSAARQGSHQIPQLSRARTLSDVMNPELLAAEGDGSCCEVGCVNFPVM